MPLPERVSALADRILPSSAGIGVSLMRAVMGLLFLKEGWSKLNDFAGTCEYFGQLGIPFPELNAYLVGYTEFLGGLLLLLGLFTRLAAVPIALTMVVAILTAHREGGWSYPLLILATCIGLLQSGAGPFSLDKRLSRKR